MGVGLIYKSENISGKPSRNAHVTGSSESHMRVYCTYIIILQQPGICRINVLGAIPADAKFLHSTTLYAHHSEGVKSAAVSSPRLSDARPLQMSSIIHITANVLYSYAVSRVTPEEVRIYYCTFVLS